MTQPTQIRRPWKATVRTVFAAVVALAAMLPLLVQASGLDETLGPVAGALAIAGAITRIMALPSVDDFLARFLPWLAADPPARVHKDRGLIYGDDDRGTVSPVEAALALLVIVVALVVVVRLLG